MPGTAIITGATGGIGSATVRRLRGAGWRLALVGRNGDLLESLLTEVVAQSTPASSGTAGDEARTGRPQAMTVVADMTRPDEVESSFAAATEQLGPPDALVHAVGSTLLKPAHITTDAELDDVLAVNLLSAFYAFRSFVRLVPRDRGASAVLFSTAATRVGLANHEAIAAAKGGIDGLVVSAAATYAPRGIRVNAIAPGLVRTNLTRRITGSEPALRASLAMHALGRVGEADEIAAAAAYLLSPDASWITGQVISVDGGLSSVRPPLRI